MLTTKPSHTSITGYGWKSRISFCLTFKLKVMPLGHPADYTDNILWTFALSIVPTFCFIIGVSNLWPTGHMLPRMTMNVAQHKTINLLKILWCISFSLAFVYLLCGPRQNFFFQGGPRCRNFDTPVNLALFCKVVKILSLKGSTNAVRTNTVPCALLSS